MHVVNNSNQVDAAPELSEQFKIILAQISGLSVDKDGNELDTPYMVLRVLHDAIPE